MKLVGSLTSPYARKIRIALLEKGLPFEFVNESPWEPTTHITDYNPLGKVPALVADDGQTFFDSPVIAEYVDALDGTVPLIPADRLESIQVKQMEALADGITDAGVIWLQETRRAAEKRDEGVIARQRGKIDRGLDVLEKRLGQAEWVYGNRFSLGDIAAGSCALWLDFRLPHYDWRTSRPALTAYVTRLAARASFAQTIPVA